MMFGRLDAILSCSGIEKYLSQIHLVMMLLQFSVEIKVTNYSLLPYIYKYISYIKMK